MVSLEGEGWWSWGDSNPRPHHCERCALPTELQPQTRSFNATMLEGLRCVRMVWGGLFGVFGFGFGCCLCFGGGFFGDCGEGGYYFF